MKCNATSSSRNIFHTFIYHCKISFVYPHFGSYFAVFIDHSVNMLYFTLSHVSQRGTSSNSIHLLCPNYLQPLPELLMYLGCTTHLLSAIYLLTHSTEQTESFLGSQPVFSQSRNSQHFMEPEGTLPRLQQPDTCAFSELDQASPRPHLTS